MGPSALVLKTPIIRREMPDQHRVDLFHSEGYLCYTAARPDMQAVRELAELIAGAQAPVVIAGQGAQSTRARALLAKVADAAGLAIAHCYNGKGGSAETSAPRSEHRCVGTGGVRT